MKVPQTDYRVPLAGPAGIRKMPVTLAAQSVAQFGETLFRIGMDSAEKQKRAREISQYSSAKVGILSDFNDFRIELAKDMDYASHEQKANTKLKEIYNSRSREITEPGVKDALKQWYDEKSIGLLFDVRVNANSIEREYMQVKLGEELAVAEKTLDQELAEELLVDAQGAGTIFPDDAERERVRIMHSIDYSEAQIGVMQNGTTWLYSKDAPDLPLNEREEIQKWYETKLKAIEDDEKKARKLELEKIQEDLVTKFYDFDSDKMTMSEFIDYVKQQDLPATEGEASKQWWIDKAVKRIKEPEDEKNRYEVTDPEIEAEVRRYINRKDKTPDEKELYIMKRQGRGLSNDDVNIYLAKIGFEAVPKPKEGKTADELTDSDLFMEITRDILDPNIDSVDVKKKIRENLGADKEGNPGLAAPDAEKLTSWDNEHNKNPVLKQGLQLFTNAHKDGYLDSGELAQITRDWQAQVATGEYTTKGMIELAEKMIADASDKYIEEVIAEREDFGWFGKKKKAKKYVAGIEPERKAGGAQPAVKKADFKTVFGSKPDDSFVDPDTGINYYKLNNRLIHYDQDIWSEWINNEWQAVSK